MYKAAIGIIAIVALVTTTGQSLTIIQGNVGNVSMPKDTDGDKI